MDGGVKQPAVCCLWCVQCFLCVVQVHRPWKCDPESPASVRQPHNYCGPLSAIMRVICLVASTPRNSHIIWQNPELCGKIGTFEAFGKFSCSNPFALLSLWNLLHISAFCWAGLCLGADGRIRWLPILKVKGVLVQPGLPRFSLP